MNDLRDKVVIITGAASGIGRDTALLLAQKGANLILLARRNNILQELANNISINGAKVTTFSCDVSKKKEVEASINNTLELFDRIDVLINCAGMGIFKPLLEMEDADILKMMEINFMGTYYCIKAVLPIMMKQPSGHIINLSSVMGKVGMPFITGYAASKFAISGFTESLRRELMGTNIKVSLICPGLTRTHFFDHIIDKYIPPAIHMTPSIPSKRVALAILRTICKKTPQAQVFVPFMPILLVKLNSLWLQIGDLLMSKHFSSIFIFIQKNIFKVKY